MHPLVSALVGAVLALSFMTSGLLVNLIQVGVFPLYWVHRRLYRSIQQWLCYFFWVQLLGAAEWWGEGITFAWYGKKEDYAKLGTVPQIPLTNHRYDLDWIIGLAVAEKYGCLGGVKSLMKMSNRYLPILGWCWWFGENVFLQRNWEKDREIMKRSFAALRDFHLVYWLSIFAEGTRFTPKKHAEGVEFAKKNGLYVPKHMLVPKTKGFVTVIDQLRDVVPGVIDCTWAVPLADPEPTFARLILGKPSTIHVLIRYFETKDLPKEDEKVAEWCRTLYREKDENLDYFFQHSTFKGYTPFKLPVHKAGAVVLAASVAFFLTLMTLVVSYALRNRKWVLLIVLAAVLAFLVGGLAVLLFGSKARDDKKARATAAVDARSTKKTE